MRKESCLCFGLMLSSTNVLEYGMLVVQMIGKCSAHLVRSDLEGKVLSLDPDDGMVHPG
jgi:hypothetical protein